MLLQSYYEMLKTTMTVLFQITNYTDFTSLLLQNLQEHFGAFECLFSDTHSSWIYHSKQNFPKCLSNWHCFCGVLHKSGYTRKYRLIFFLNICIRDVFPCDDYVSTQIRHYVLWDQSSPQLTIRFYLSRVDKCRNENVLSATYFMASLVNYPIILYLLLPH